MSQAARPRPRLSPQVLERIAVVALLLLAFVPRVRDIGRGFDRGFEGYQGSFHAIAAANYEGLGAGAAGGYPVLNIDRPESAQDWFVYANHSPATPLLAWAGLKFMGPAGWAAEWQAGETPAGVEAPMRSPFLLLHMLGILALWWVARVAFGTQVALIALALVSSLPVSALYGSLVNVETPSVPFLLVAVACYGNYVRAASRVALVGMGIAFFGGCAVTYGPAFCLPFLCLRSLWKRRPQEALIVGAVGALACLAPILLHGWWANHVLAGLGKSPASLMGRAQELLQPLLAGDLPLSAWIGLQLEHAGRAQGYALIPVAAVGLLLCALRGLSSSKDERLARLEWPAAPRENVDLATPLLLGACLYLFAFYKHTAQEQWSFQLYLVPGVCLLAARALHSISLPLQRLRGGIAPLVLCTGTIMLPGLARFENWRGMERAAGPRDDAALSRGPAAPLPQTVGVQLAQLLPAGSVGFHPSALGLTPAAAWYAHRSLFPVANPGDPAIDLVLQATGLASAPQFFVLPKDPAPQAAQAVQDLRAAFADVAPTYETDKWAAWSR